MRVWGTQQEMQVDEEEVRKSRPTCPSSHQVNFTQSFEKSQEVKCELGAVPSVEGEVDVNERKTENRKQIWRSQNSCFLLLSQEQNALFVCVCVAPAEIFQLRVQDWIS